MAFGSPSASGKAGLNVPPYDEVQVTYPDSITEVFEYKLETETVATVTIVYVDSKKKDIVSVIKT